MTTSSSGMRGVFADPQFLSPSTEYWPAAYWFWHHIPGTDEIEEPLRDLYHGGYRTVLVQCRLAFPHSQYLSGEFLDRLEQVANAAERLKMQLGIYDDYNWQSGMAGGRTVHGHDELREQHVFWTTQAAGSTTDLVVSNIQGSVAHLGQAAVQWQYEGGRVEWTDWVLIAALLYPVGNPVPSRVRDVTSRAEIVSWSAQHCRVRMSLSEVPTGYQVTVYVSARSATSRVPNYLLKETAQRYIEVDYEPVRQRLGRHFGKTVSYFFYDQPHPTFYDWNERHGNLQSSLPWCEDLVKALESATRCTIGLVLLALVENLGPDTAMLRAQSYETFAQMTLDSFFGPLKTWALQHGVGFTGHEVLGHVGGWSLHHAFPHADLRTNFGCDYFGIDTYRTLTAVDAEGTSPQLSAKLGDSVGRSHGRRGCIVEQYFISPSLDTAQYIGRWDLTLEALRSQTIRHYLGGARQLLFHAYCQTPGTADDLTPLKNPRFDFAPGINFEPWWRFHGAFAKESARLSAFLQGAEPVTEVAVLFPLRTAWAEGPEHPYGTHLGYWARFLAEWGYGYHLIDERDLIDAQITAGHMRIGSGDYQALVLPAVTTLKSRSSLKPIARFLQGGGLVLATGPVLASYQDGYGDASRDWSQLVRSQPRLQWRPSPADLDDAFMAELNALREQRPYALASIPSGLWQLVGRDPGGWRMALFNDQTIPIEAILRFPVPTSSLSLWDVESGETVHLGVSSRQVRWSLDPMELICLHAAVPVLNTPPRDSMRPWQRVGIQGRLAAARTQMVLSTWHFSADGGWTFVPIDVTQPWERQGYPHLSGMGRYVCETALPGREGWLYLPEVGTAATVTINGVVVGQRGWRPYVFHVPARVVKDGLNQVQVDVYNTAANAYYAHTPYQFAQTASGLYSTPKWFWGLGHPDPQPIKWEDV